MDAIRAKIKLIKSETQKLKDHNEKYKEKIKQITQNSKYANIKLD
jgi:hypothetical protein